MTDTRLRGEWLNTIRFDDLSDTAWRVFTNAMMWCNENGTDGEIPSRYLRMVHPDGLKPDAYAEMQRAQLWHPTDDGYKFNDWDGALGQETAERVELNRENSRRRQRAKRERDKQALEKALGKSSPSFVSSRVTSHPDSQSDVTGARSGVRRNRNTEQVQDRLPSELVETSPPEPDAYWPVATIPKSAPYNEGRMGAPGQAAGLPKCACGNLIYNSANQLAGRCARCLRAEVSNVS